jgi:hypothetical protein
VKAIKGMSLSDFAEALGISTWVTPQLAEAVERAPRLVVRIPHKCAMSMAAATWFCSAIVHRDIKPDNQ